MARKFLTPIDLTKLEIQNVALQNLGSDPGTPATGQIYFNTGGTVKVYNGTSWLSLSTTSGTVTSVTGTSPVVSSGGTTPAISLASGYGDTLNPYATKTNNYVLAGAASGGSTTPTFRALVAADIPNTLNATTFGGAVAMGNNKITGLGTPTAAADAATKDYVDNVSAGINIHAAVVATTTGTISGTYAAGSTTANPPGDGGTGVGATITYAATGVVTLDTSVTLAAGDRVLVKNGVTTGAAGTTSSIANGIYVVTTAGAVGTAAILTRSTDADNSNFGDLTAGDLVYVIGGDTFGGDQFVQTAKGTATQGSGSATTYSIKIGTDAISYTQFSGSGAIPFATDTVAGIASFPTAQFSVATGAVTINNLSGGVITSGTVADTYIASALTGKTYNKLTITAPATGATLAITNLKTFSVSNSLTLAGTDNTTMTFPSTSATIARTDAAQTFTGTQTVEAASTQDAVKIAGRAGGASSYAVTLTPATLAGSVTLTLPSSQATQGFTLARTLTGTVVVSSGTGTITHNMNNQYVLVQIFDNSTNALVDMDVTLATANTVTVAATTDATYRYVIIG
jgi:hypothetical protein